MCSNILNIKRFLATNRVFYQHHHDHCAHGDAADAMSARCTSAYSPRTGGLTHDGMATIAVTRMDYGHAYWYF